MMKLGTNTIRRWVIGVLPLYLFTFLPLNAQVGTWRTYMSYYEPQQIVKAGDDLFVRASNDLYSTTSPTSR